MKATITITDRLGKKSIELTANVAALSDAAQVMNQTVRRKANRERILKELKLYFGQADLTMTRHDTGEVIAQGTIETNVFAGGGRVECRNVEQKAA